MGDKSLWMTLICHLTIKLPVKIDAMVNMKMKSNIKGKDENNSKL